MLSRLLLLQQLLPAAGSLGVNGSTSSVQQQLLHTIWQQLPCTAAVVTRAFSAVQPRQQQQQQQQQEQQEHTPHQQPPPHRQRAQPSIAAADAQPVQPVAMILKVIMCADRPLTSHELWAQVQQEYGSFLPSRSQFKKQLKGMLRNRLVKAQAPAKAGIGKLGDPFVFSATKEGMAMDLNAGGTKLQLQARALADAWTEQKLPQYKQHLEAGRVPLTADNQGLVPPAVKQKLFQQQRQQPPKPKLPTVPSAWEQQVQALEGKRQRR